MFSHILDDLLKTANLLKEVVLGLIFCWGIYLKIRRRRHILRSFLIGSAVIVSLAVVGGLGWFLLVPPCAPPISHPPRLSQSLTLARDHLGQPGVTARTQRFLLLAPLQAGGSERTTACREALESLLGQVVQAVDPDRWVYAVDLERLGHEPSTLWDQIVQGCPYGLDLEEHSDPQAAAAYRDLSERTGDNLPWLRADWFLLRYANVAKLSGTAVAKVAQNYQEPLTLADLAADLDLSGPKELIGKIEQSAVLRDDLGLGRLLDRSTALPRQKWAGEDEPVSLFQKAALELNLGVPLHRATLPAAAPAPYGGL